jgi:hypothetical protein
MDKLKVLVSVAATLLLCACSGGSDDTLAGVGGGGAGGGGGGGGAGTQAVRMGNGFGAGFQEGLLNLGVTTLSAGGSTGVTATFVTSTGDLHTGAVDVTFNSACVGQGLATLTTPISTTTGIANATYAAGGCSGGDVITATATVDGTTLTASATVTVAPASVGSIQFISATPTNIGLQGTGGAGRSETSVVVFRVVDSTGGPVSNVSVQFSLNTQVGGISVAPLTATTDFDGRVQTVVQSGSAATTVRVSAIVIGATPAIGTQSDQLTVTTGIPDQDSFSLSIETLNPEAWAVDGVTSAVTVRLSDRFNNPVPNGTAVTLTAEGGQIGSQCVTVDGACTVDWVSQSPRPADGRVTLLASAIGEESFFDSDGNGRYTGNDTFTDIPEPFRDDDESGTRDAIEPFNDFNSSGTYDVGDGLFNGLLCDATTGDCATSNTVAVSDTGVIVMSGCDVDTSVFPASVTLPATVGGELRDMRGQPLPAGTTISFATDNGTIQGPDSYTYPNTTAVQQYGVQIAADATAPASGILEIEIVCPSGLTQFVLVDVDD